MGNLRFRSVKDIESIIQTNFPTSDPQEYQENALVMDFFHHYQQFLDRLVVELFSSEEWKQAVKRRNVQQFLKNPAIVERVFSKLLGYLPEIDWAEIDYPGLYWIAEPLFLILKQCRTEKGNPRLLWGGINYWDQLSQVFYTEQFTNFEGNEDNHIFRSLMENWVLRSERSSRHLLPLTELLFKHTTQHQTVLFYKDIVNDEEVRIPDLTIELDRLGKLVLVKLEGYYALRQSLVPLINEIRNQIASFAQNYDYSKKLGEEYLGSKQYNFIERLYEPLQKLERKLGVMLQEYDVLRLINLFLTFELAAPMEWKYIVYIPARLRQNSPVGGVLLALTKLLEMPIYLLAQQIMNRIFEFPDLVLFTERMLEEATHSAVAGIMSRNMSHNIGSHVLASTELLKGVHRVEIQKLHNFLQQRMDFIAQVVTYTPSWNEPIFFFNDFLQRFLDQYLLLGHLIKDQGYSNIQVVAHSAEKQWIFEKEEGSRCENESCDRPSQGLIGERTCQCGSTMTKTGRWLLKANSLVLNDFLVAIPGGIIGAHAFYDILENIMRNSAKYGEHQNEFVLHIQAEEDDNRYHITVWDNLSIRGDHNGRLNCSCRVCKVQKSLQEELINPMTGEMEIQSRGVHEMKECARILTYPYEEWGFQRDGKRYALWADGITYKGQEYLSLQFYLQKPRLIGIVHASRTADAEARKAGVFHYPDLQELTRHPHQFGLIFMPNGKEEQHKVFEFIGDHHHLLPYRLLLIANNKTDDAMLQRDFKIPKRRVRWCKPDEISWPGDCNEQDWLNFVIRIYALWLQKFKETTNESKWQLFVAFDREAGHSAFTRWQDSLKGFESPVMDVHVVGPANNNNGIILAASTRQLTAEGLKSFIEQNPDKCLWLDNHRKISSILQVDTSKLHFYHDFGVNALKLYHALESPPPAGFGFKFFVLGLLESALTSVLIVDERVAEATFDENEGFAKGLLVNLREAQCYPAYSIWTTNQETAERTFVSDAIQRHDESVRKSGLIHIDDEEGVHLKSDGPSVKIQKFSDTMEKPEVEEKTQFDFIIIHQGVIDRLSNLNRWEEETHIAQLYELSPAVAITSGRGHTLRHIPETMPFIEFSIVRESTYAGLSKYHLVRALLSVAGKKEGRSQ